MNMIHRLTLTIVLSCASFAVFAGDMKPMKDMMKQQIMTTCDDAAFLSCIGIDKKKCVSAVEKTLASCDHLFPKDLKTMDDAAMNAHSDCITQNMLKHSGVSSSKLDSCDTLDSAAAPPMDPAQGMAMMNQAMQAHAAAVGTDDVTLPLYKNATVMSHFANGEMAQMFKDVEPLPALMMSSPDSADKVAHYYRKNLKGFKEYKIEGGILFMEKGPKDFDMLKHMHVYVSTPHVAVFDDDGGIKNAKSKIEIAYRKK